MVVDMVVVMVVAMVVVKAAKDKRLSKQEV